VDWAKVHAANPQGFVDWLGTCSVPDLTGEEALSARNEVDLHRGRHRLLCAGCLQYDSFRTRPPKKVETGADRFAWLEALKLLKHPFVLILWLVTIVVPLRCTFILIGRVFFCPQRRRPGSESKGIGLCR